MGAFPDQRGFVSMLLGNGDGTFQTVSSYTVGRSPRSVAVGDFNGDGQTDLVVANTFDDAGTISVLLGNGAGSFQSARNFGAGGSSPSVDADDFPADRLQDPA